MSRRLLLIALAIAAIGSLVACGSSGSTGGCPTCPVVEPPPPPPPPPNPPAPPAPTLQYTRFMAFGDSLTEGESAGALRSLPAHNPGTPGIATSYPARLYALLTAHYPTQTLKVFNGGFGGEQVLQALPRFEEYLDEHNPQVVILMHGVNDLVNGTDIEEVIDGIERLIEAAKKRSMRVLLSTLPRQRPDGRRAVAAPLIVPFNAELKTLASAVNVPVIDIYPHIPTTMLTPDGLHITAAGNQKLAELYFEALRARYEQPATAGLE